MNWKQGLRVVLVFWAAVVAFGLGVLATKAFDFVALAIFCVLLISGVMFIWGSHA